MYFLWIWENMAVIQSGRVKKVLWQEDGKVQGHQEEGHLEVDGKLQGHLSASPQGVPQMNIFHKVTYLSPIFAFILTHQPAARSIFPFQGEKAPRSAALPILSTRSCSQENQNTG